MVCSNGQHMHALVRYVNGVSQKHEAKFAELCRTVRVLSEENAAQSERFPRLQAALSFEDVADLDAIAQSGLYKCGPGAAGAPHSGTAWEIAYVGSGSSVQGLQIAVSAKISTEQLMRTRISGPAWSPWCLIGPGMPERMGDGGTRGGLVMSDEFDPRPQRTRGCRRRRRRGMSASPSRAACTSAQPSPMVSECSCANTAWPTQLTRA